MRGGVSAWMGGLEGGLEGRLTAVYGLRGGREGGGLVGVLVVGEKEGGEREGVLEGGLQSVLIRWADVVCYLLQKGPCSRITDIIL